jgi:hypothetical protein
LSFAGLQLLLILGDHAQQSSDAQDTITADANLTATEEAAGGTVGARTGTQLVYPLASILGANPDCVLVSSRVRWKIERFVAWIGDFRRPVVRYERQIMMFLAFVHVACLLIAIRQS